MNWFLKCPSLKVCSFGMVMTFFYPAILMLPSKLGFIAMSLFHIFVLYLIWQWDVSYAGLFLFMILLGVLYQVRKRWNIDYLWVRRSQ
ncbi:hypothetical protein GHNINEIG_01926 [Hydrogenovibrio crunogenus]|uniref:Uncharacterized protein n=1 Tax=Hydrogenovibrio crunogenus TaxID=39765 RepID=A0A4P7P1C8_9GAMM|nr:hypothetical protein GHNINEIG_01926 [Hydrogenovibrio crunogenus]